MRAAYHQLARHASELEATNRALQGQGVEPVADASRDGLTGLPHGGLVEDRLEQCLERQRRSPGYHYAVLLLDVDNFKLISDSMGPGSGDEAADGRLFGAGRD